MVENEIKYIVRWSAELEKYLTRTFGYVYIEQAYLNDRARIRKKSYGDNSLDPDYIFTYKQHMPNGRNLEIETSMTKIDYLGLIDFTSNQLIKTRVTVHVGNICWDIDFPHWKHGRHFIVAEAEMPDDMEEPDALLPVLQPHVVYAVPRADRRFTARRLSDEKTAMALAYELGLR